MKRLNSEYFKLVEFDQFKNKFTGNQMNALKNNLNIKKLEILQQEVNEDNKYLS